MDNKQLWTTVIVAAVVAVLASLVTAGIMQNVALAPRGNTVNSGGGSSIINAHACSADETCEVNELLVNEEVFTDSVISTDPNKILYLTSANDIILNHGTDEDEKPARFVRTTNFIADGSISTPSLNADRADVEDKIRLTRPDGFYWGLLKPQGTNDLAIFNKKSATYPIVIKESTDSVRIKNFLTIEGMSVNGSVTSYVCVQPDGTLFRSATACN